MKHHRKRILTKKLVTRWSGGVQRGLYGLWLFKAGPGRIESRSSLKNDTGLRGREGMHDLARRLKLAALVVIGGGALVAVPAAQGAPPIRNVFPAPEPFVIAAGYGCSFDVAATPVGHHAITEFADGRTVTVGHGDVTLTNGDASYLQVSRFMETDTFPDADTVKIVVNGQVMIQFYPGDQGPFGEVGEPGALYAFDGTVSATVDLNTFVVTSFSNEGTATDLCAILAS
jgi:hypothetical protein